jgi:hypothetical protein
MLAENLSLDEFAQRAASSDERRDTYLRDAREYDRKQRV